MELWTSEHAMTLPAATVLMLIIAAILRKTIGDKPLKIRMIPFQILACILFLIEIGKQAVSFSRGYDLYHIPLHFCSLFIFLLPAMAFYNGRHKSTITAVTTAWSASMFSLLLIYPNLIYGAGDVRNFFTEYMSMHTVVFHNIVLFEFILIVFLSLHTPEPKRDTRAIIIFILCFCAVAGIMAQLLRTNYANFYECNIPPLEALRTSVRDAIGAAPAQVLYVLIVSACNVGYVMLFYWLYTLVAKVFKNKEKQAELTA